MTSSELNERHQLPHFDVRELNGRRVRYDELWQCRNLVLVLIDSTRREEATRSASVLSAHRDEFDDAEAAVVVTADSVQGLRGLLASSLQIDGARSCTSRDLTRATYGRSRTLMSCCSGCDSREYSAPSVRPDDREWHLCCVVTTPEEGYA